MSRFLHHLSRHLSRRGGKGRLVFLTWLGVYPILTVTALALQPFLKPQPVWLQSLIMSVIMVPFMVMAVMPSLKRWL